jgi:hypothetical protein
MVEMRDAFKILVRKHEGKIPLLRRRCRQNNNINMDLGEMGWEVVDYLVQNRNQWHALLNMVMNLWVT